MRLKSISIGRRLLAMIFGLVVLAGCAVTLISSYDETTDKGVTSLQKSVDELMNKLDQDAFPAYKTVKKDYDKIRSDFNSIYFRNEARPNNALTLKQLDELKAQLVQVEKMHKDKMLNRAMVGQIRNTLNQTFRAILTLELKKKELNEGTASK